MRIDIPKTGWLCAALVAITIPSCGLSSDRAVSPALTVVLVVDQMRADYLDRFGHLFEGGLARLREEGVAFTDAHQDHSRTVTAPGHATIATGVFPARHGIVGNDFLDRTEGEIVYSASDPSEPLLGLPDAEGRSPRRLRREGLADWLLAAHPEARVFSVSLKDRSAIMLGGRAPDGAYWYHGDAGGLVTSSYYASSDPDWVTAFDARGRVASHYETGWDRALPEEAYVELGGEDADETEGEGGPFHFPYLFNEIFPPDSAGAPGWAYYEDFTYTPFADGIVLEFARAAVENEGLGEDEVPDLLMVGASAGDYIGHRWGPYSHELQDYYIRLDRYLGDFFSFLDERVGEERWALVLSGDHGVAPAPEESARRGTPARRIPTSEFSTAVREALRWSFEDVPFERPPSVRWMEGPYLLSERHDDTELEPLREAIARRLEALDFVAAAYTKDEIEAADIEGRDEVDAFLRSHDPERSPDVALRLEPFHIVGSTPATHGSSYEYDTHVPLVFRFPGLEAGSHDGFTRTVDIAPTILAWLDIVVPGDLDGHALEPVIR